MRPRACLALRRTWSPSPPAQRISHGHDGWVPKPSSPSVVPSIPFFSHPLLRGWPCQTKTVEISWGWQWVRTLGKIFLPRQGMEGKGKLASRAISLCPAVPSSSLYVLLQSEPQQELDAICKAIDSRMSRSPETVEFELHIKIRWLFFQS